MEKDNRFFSKDAWRAVLIALVLVIGGELILAWQYNRLEQKRIPQIEQELQRQREEAEKEKAELVLTAFLDARIAKDSTKITRYITEQAALQRQEGAFEFFGVQNYEIQERGELGEGAFRFRVELTRDRLKQIEIVELVKIGENYYVNSVQLAG